MRESAPRAPRKIICKILKNLCLLTLSGICALTTSNANAANDSALLDALVRKGILTNKEAEEVQSEAARNAPLLGPKIIVGDWVKELKLSGDLRIRNQWDERNPQLPKAPNQTNYDGNIQRDRWRFRLRLNADFKLAGNFFGGVQLSTSDNRNAATGNATYTGGFDNYNIYISRAFLGWNPTPALTFIAGKQANPFYTTDLFWSPDVNPTGLVERVDFHKMFDFPFGEPTVGYAKDGKSVPPPAPEAGNASTGTIVSEIWETRIMEQPARFLRALRLMQLVRQSRGLLIHGTHLPRITWRGLLV